MLWRVILALVSGACLTLLFPPFSLSILGWVALVPLLVAVQGVVPWQGALLGWLCGTVGGLGVTGYWMYHAASAYFGLPAWGAAAFTVAVNQIFVSLYFALFGWGVAWARVSNPVVLAAFFVAAEYGRAHVLSGNPWAQLGQAQDSPIWMQVCDLTGVYGLSFLQAWTAAALLHLRRSWRPLFAAAAVLLLVCAYGSWRLQSRAQEGGSTLSIVLVQGALPNGERGLPHFYAQHLQSYLDLSASLAIPRGALVVWPENAVGFFPVENMALLEGVSTFLSAQGAGLLFGAPRAAGGAGVAAIHNSVYGLRDGKLDPIYDKRVLLPFVESMPLRPADGPYLAGNRPGMLTIGSTKIGVLICYEAIYAGLARELGRDGVGVLINFSNDAWFDAGAGPEQHFQAAKFRAVENRIALVRVTDSGVSGVVDADGRETARLPSRRAMAQLVEVPVGGGHSFYSTHGDVLALACVWVTTIALGRRALAGIVDRRRVRKE